MTRHRAGSDDEGSPTDGLARLREVRADLRARLVFLGADMATFIDASRDSNADDEHDPEGQTIAFERAQLAAVTDQVGDHLREVDAALGRLADGTYGVCEVCQQAINPERLEARPTARTCVDHVASPGRATSSARGEG